MKAAQPELLFIE